MQLAKHHVVLRLFSETVNKKEGIKRNTFFKTKALRTSVGLLVMSQRLALLFVFLDVLFRRPILLQVSRGCMGSLAVI